MAEYQNVEKPFLAKLREIDWTVIDHGAYGIPADPATSLRTSFSEVTLAQTFKDSVRSINLVDGKPWLTDSQLDTIYKEVTVIERTHTPLLESNKHIHELLTGVQKTTVSINELTGEQDVQVQLMDYDHWERNSFVAINQFRIVTPGGPREGIIPDIVLFVNGLPFVVIECKDTDVAQPLSEAFIQISRYANIRDGDSFAVKEGEERLFHYNLFSIITHGTEARVGSITGGYEYYLNWKDIFPEIYKQRHAQSIAADPLVPYLGKNQKASNLHQNTLIEGMLNKEIILDVLRHFTLFMEIKKGVEIKIISRYQQYRAVGKILDRMRTGTTPAERSGVVWHTQGSGKSLTMIFLIRKLRSQADLRDYKVIMMVDRTSLERQLSETAMLTGEFKDKNVVSSRREVTKKLSTDNSDLHMVMIHKFIQEDLQHSKELLKAYNTEGIVPIFKPFDVINESDRIVILIDEAHRSQGGDMGNNFFAAFPNAAKIAFTGTPLLTERHKQKTHERFGGNDFIDTYKIRQAVDDRATLDIIYIGKTTKDEVKDREAFDRAFEDEFKERSKEEREIIQKKYGTMQAYLENKDRLGKIASDLVEHYIKEILPNGYKAMVVANSVIAAARYEILINQEIAKRLALEKSKSEPDQELIVKLGMLDACTEVTMQDNNEESYISAARKKAKSKKAIDNFKKDFDFSVDQEGNYKKPETGIAFLSVCDRLLTGFDAPIAQVMYLDKPLREHNLLQAIARVNRTKDQKSHGILVDYYGVSNNLREALMIWGAEDEEDIKELMAYFRDINKEIPVLEARYNRMIQLFEDRGIADFRAFATQQVNDTQRDSEIAELCIDFAENIPFRAQFDTYLKAFFDSLDLLFNSKVADDYYIPAKRFGYLLMRIRNRYQDSTLDLKWAKSKVRKLIDEYLTTLDINSKIPPVSLLSKEFPTELDKLKGSAKSKASQMEHAIRRHIKVNNDKDPAMYNRFYKRMEDILAKYRDNWLNQVELLAKLRKDMADGRAKENVAGLNEEEAPFYDLLVMKAFEDKQMDEAQSEAMKEIVKTMVDSLKDAMNTPLFWSRDSNIRSLRGEIELELLSSSIEEIFNNNEFLANSILQLAKQRNDELTGE